MTGRQYLYYSKLLPIPSSLQGTWDSTGHLGRNPVEVNSIQKDGGLLLLPSHWNLAQTRFCWNQIEAYFLGQKPPAAPSERRGFVTCGHWYMN